MKPDYLERLRSYLRAVKQRNVLLRDHATAQAIKPWHEEVARLGESVSADRESYLKQVVPHFHGVLAEFAPELSLDVRYQRGWSRDEALDKLLGESSPREVKYASTLWGPHRADLQIRQNGVPAATVLSRGQGKMVASALQIGQASLLADEEQRSTVFLIDDAGAELDLAHNERFYSVLRRIGGQILATTTRKPSPDEGLAPPLAPSRVFHVKHGEVEQ